MINKSTARLHYVLGRYPYEREISEATGVPLLEIRLPDVVPESRTSMKRRLSNIKQNTAKRGPLKIYVCT
jgi:hypothetical protein